MLIEILSNRFLSLTANPLENLKKPPAGHGPGPSVYLILSNRFLSLTANPLENLKSRRQGNLFLLCMRTILFLLRFSQYIRETNCPAGGFLDFPADWPLG
jgi:hypothetical protein